MLAKLIPVEDIPMTLGRRVPTDAENAAGKAKFDAEMAKLAESLKPVAWVSDCRVQDGDRAHEAAPKPSTLLKPGAGASMSVTNCSNYSVWVDGVEIPGGAHVQVTQPRDTGERLTFRKYTPLTGDSGIRLVDAACNRYGTELSTRALKVGDRVDHISGAEGTLVATMGDRARVRLADSGVTVACALADLSPWIPF